MALPEGAHPPLLPAGWGQRALGAGLLLVAVAELAAAAVLLAPRSGPAACDWPRFLVIGDWGRDGDYNQSATADAMAARAAALRPHFVVSDLGGAGCLVPPARCQPLLSRAPPPNPTLSAPLSLPPRPASPLQVSTGDSFYDSGLRHPQDPQFATSFSDVYHQAALQVPGHDLHLFLTFTCSVSVNSAGCNLAIFSTLAVSPTNPQVPWHAVLGNHDYGEVNDGDPPVPDCSAWLAGGGGGGGGSGDGGGYYSSSIGGGGGRTDNSSSISGGGGGRREEEEECFYSPLHQLGPALPARDARWHCERAFTLRLAGGEVEIFFVDTTPLIKQYLEYDWASNRGEGAGRRGQPASLQGAHGSRVAAARPAL